MPKQVPRAGATKMTKVNTAVAQKAVNSPAAETTKTPMAIVKTEVKPDAKSEPTLQERILRVENLQLLVNKRAKLVQTRSELEKFQISSNDFNCTMQMKDSDGNSFTTSFTPGIKKVIDFLKSSFDGSIKDVESQIKF